MEIFQAASQARNSVSCVAPTDRQLPLIATSDRKVGPKGMGFGKGHEPIHVYFGAWEITGPKKHGNCPDQGNGQRHRMGRSRGLVNGLACPYRGLSRMALQP